ncbi:MAG: hypothetical protein KDN22_05970 [Verrucomicrobiae bacterium]|nr:hypothetical protein [Verrucomicrobiae bacterium]
MFGYFGSPCSGCRGGDARAYRSFFCGLCNRLRGDYGLPARFLVNRDSTFLAVLAAAQMREQPVISRSTCCNPFGKKREHFETGPAVTYASAVTVFGLEMKLRDNALDDSGWNRSVASGLLSMARGSFEHARAVLGATGLCPATLAAGFDEQAERERAFAAERKNLELVTAPTSTAYSAIISQTAALQGADTRISSGSFAQFGNHLGSLVYLLDAATDRDRDRKTGAFNPVHHIGLPAVTDAALQRVGQLEEITSGLQGEFIHFGDLIGQLVSSLRATAQTILAPQTATPTEGERKKKRKKSKDNQSSCCDYCDCVPTCDCCRCCDCCKCCGKGGCDCDCPCCCCD